MSLMVDSVMILFIGFFAGIINTMAGGGSLLTLPLLIFMGLPSSVANGTNRIAVFAQSLTASSNFYRKGYIDVKLALLFGIPAIIGSFIGANMAVQITDALFNKILAIIMVIAVIFIVLNPKQHIDTSRMQAWGPFKKAIGMIAFFGIGIYGGFIQAGVGFFIIIFLTGYLNFSLITSNAVKNIVVSMYIFCSLFVFIFHGDIHWLYGLILAVGMAAGAWTGSQLAIKKETVLLKSF